MLKNYRFGERGEARLGPQVFVAAIILVVIIAGIFAVDRRLDSLEDRLSYRSPMMNEPVKVKGKRCQALYYGLTPRLVRSTLPIATRIANRNKMGASIMSQVQIARRRGCGSVGNPKGFPNILRF